MANAFEITEPKSGRGANVLHSFFRMDDGSFLAFFEAPSRPFEFRDQHDFDLHIALEVDAETLDRMFEAGKAAGIDTRGVADHGFIRSIYFRDPNGYVVELSAKVPDGDGELSPGEARAALDSWQEAKARVLTHVNSAATIPRYQWCVNGSGVFAIKRMDPMRRVGQY